MGLVCGLAAFFPEREKGRRFFVPALLWTGRRAGPREILRMKKTLRSAKGEGDSAFSRPCTGILFFAWPHIEEGVRERSVTVGGFISRKKNSGYRESFSPRPGLV